MVTRRLGELLIDENKITESQLMEALKLQKVRGHVLGQILVEEGYVTESEIIEVLEIQYGIPRVELKSYEVDPQVPNLINAKMARRYTLIPIRLEDNNLSVAMADPLNIFAIDDLKLATGLEIVPLLASEKDILIAIEQYFKKRAAEDTLSEFSDSFTRIGNADVIDFEMLSQVNSAPVVKLIDSTILQAAEGKVSDIHIEPEEEQIRIRFRVDGDLIEHMSLKKSSLSAVITRIKIMGGMNIAENRIPQDGRVELDFQGRRIDLRISIMPTVHGEKVVMRLLDRSNKILTVEELGMSPYNVGRFEKITSVPHGIVLVTGPTGSGKSTTLYATLMKLNDVKKNIITVEDPVEYRLNGVNQTQVNTKAGLTFASCLRAILRQDPDVIMLGEIRDSETAEIAVRASITGHVVLSTLHTNDTASSVSRLVDMGIEPYLVASSLVGVVAQRLVKKICSNCKEEYPITVHEAKLLETGQANLTRGKGCNLCNHTGYRGRTAIYEILPVTRAIRDMIDAGENGEAIKDKAIQGGMTTLFKSCLELVLEGVTTADELFRITNVMD